MRQIGLGLRADVKVLCLESSESSQAVGNLQDICSKQTMESKFTDIYNYILSTIVYSY